MSSTEGTSQENDVKSVLANLKAEVQAEAAHLKAEGLSLKAEAVAFEHEVQDELARLKTEVAQSDPDIEEGARLVRKNAESRERARQTHVKTQEAQDGAREAIAQIEDALDEKEDIPRLIKGFHEEREAALRRTRRMAYLSTLLAVVIGVFLLWVSTKAHGFISVIVNALGTGMLTAGTVGVAVTLISNKLFPPDAREKLILQLVRELDRRTDDIIGSLRRAQIEYHEKAQKVHMEKHGERRAQLIGQIAELKFRLAATGVIDEDGLNRLRLLYSELSDHDRWTEDLQLRRGDWWFGSNSLRSRIRSCQPCPMPT